MVHSEYDRNVNDLQNEVRFWRSNFNGFLENMYVLFPYPILVITSKLTVFLESRNYCVSTRNLPFRRPSILHS